MTTIDQRYVAPPDVKHGTRNGYVNHLCRCPKCTEANTVYMRGLRARRAERRRLVTFQQRNGAR
jgi:hypothetical protein